MLKDFHFQVFFCEFLRPSLRPFKKMKMKVIDFTASSDKESNTEA